MVQDAARKLFLELGAGGQPRAEPGTPAEATLARLKALSSALHIWYEAADTEGDLDQADRLDRLITRITVMRISIGQAVQRFIDTAPAVTDAVAAIEAVHGKLDEACDQAARQAARLGEVTAVLDGLAKLVGWVQG